MKSGHVPLINTDTMESSENWLGRKSLEAAMPKKFRKEINRNDGSTLNWAMLLLCLGSFGISAILAYREIQLESRISSLEARCDHQETSEVIVKRLRREVQEAFLGQKIPYPESPMIRIKRDVGSECNCPAGKYFIFSQFFKFIQGNFLFLSLYYTNFRVVCSYILLKNWRKWKFF